MSEEDTSDVKEILHGLVLYCDGGSRPNPGFGGIGIHGFTYLVKPADKGNGKSFITTSKGYMEKAESKESLYVPEDKKQTLSCFENRKPVAVTPIKYVDITASIAGMTTNNICEIIAMTKALEYANKISEQVPLTYINIHTDSKYTKDGTTAWIDGWITNNWIKNDGTPVMNADLWKELKKARDVINSKGIILDIEWIQAHNGDVGNEKADMLASIGVFEAQRGVSKYSELESEPESYWKNNIERHPFIAQKRCYFRSQSQIVPGVYHLGDHGKDDELLGKRMSTGCFSVIELTEPDDTIEMVRRYQAELAGNSDSIFAIHLDQLFSDGVYQTFDTYGQNSLEPPNGYRLDLKHAGKKPITREFKPPRLAERAIDELVQLHLLLDKFKAESSDIALTDITKDIYVFNEKKIPPKKGQSTGTVEITQKIRPELVVGTTHIAVKGNSPFKDGEGNTIVHDIKLTTGIDILDRNYLKKLESLNPVVFLVTWPVSDAAYRYATVVQAQGNYGIWCGVYSNLRLLNGAKEEAKK